MSGLNIVAAAVCAILLPVMAPAAENRANVPEAASGDMCGSVQVNVWQTVSRDREFRDALSLYGRGMYADAQAMFAGIAAKTGDMEAEGYRVLCAIHLGQDGYPVMMKDYIARYPYSGLIPQMRFFHALNLFDAEDYKGASEELGLLSRRQLYRSQVPEFLFRKAYCDLENGLYDRALSRFDEVIDRAASDFTAPSMYFSGYILYQQEKFPEAAERFASSAKDPRFAEISNYYILECRFMAKDYGYVVQNGPEMMDRVPQGRRPQLARLISESYLVLGNASEARRYYDRNAIPDAEKTRTDYFYAGSLMYAVRDWAGAAENFSMMSDRTDSLGQIASYQMAYSYIQLKNKVAALEAFREASLPQYNPEMAEDAYYNYAKLAFDLNNDISGFDGYLARYSDLKRGDRVYSYIAVGALRNRDYAAAVEAYDKVETLDPVMKTNYMKANYLRANELVRDGSWRAAIPCLKAAAYYSDRREMFNQMSRFWLAEAYFRDEQYDMSLETLRELYNTSALYGMEESRLIPYNIAYCHFRKGDYPSAVKWFSEYLGTGSSSFRKEALLRKADCLFLLRDYAGARTAYQDVLDEYFDVNDIYPYYYAGLSCGLTGDNQGRIRTLSPVSGADPASPYYADATMELGRALAAGGRSAEAEECFRRVLDNARDSTYMAMSLIELGTLARNGKDMDTALKHYRTVVEKMPLSEYTGDALAAIESIYQSRNDPQSYLAYIESIGMSSIKTDAEKEAMIYNAAEQIFLTGNYEKALAALQAYLNDYPSGSGVSSAEFYMGESCRALGRKEQACDHYAKVMRSGSGSYRELAALHYSDLTYSLQRYADSFSGYSFLRENALMEENRSAALTGMMRSAYSGKMYDAAIENAALVASDSRSGAGLRTEADYVTAKSYMATSQRDKAIPVLERLSSRPDTDYGAEASYLLVRDSYDRGDFADVETRVYAFSESENPQQYWLAKSFVVLGDAFAETGDYEQAKATFESVRDGYNPDSPDDVKDDLDLRIRKLEELISSGTEESSL